MKKLFLILFLFLDSVIYAQTPCTPGGAWNRCGRAQNSTYIPELNSLDSLFYHWAAIGGIPVTGGGGGGGSTDTIINSAYLPVIAAYDRTISIATRNIDSLENLTYAGSSAGASFAQITAVATRNIDSLESLTYAGSNASAGNARITAIATRNIDSLETIYSPLINGNMVSVVTNTNNLPLNQQITAVATRNADSILLVELPPINTNTSYLPAIASTSQITAVATRNIDSLESLTYAGSNASAGNARITAIATRNIDSLENLTYAGSSAGAVNAQITAVATRNMDSLLQYPLPTTGLSASATATPTISISAYTAGMEVGGIMSFTLLRTNSGTGQLMSNMVIENGSNKSPLTILLFSQNPSNGTYADHTPFALNATDAQYLIRAIPVAQTDYISAGGFSVVDNTAIGKVIRNTNAGKTIYAIVVTTSTPTYNTTSALSFTFGIIQD